MPTARINAILDAMRDELDQWRTETEEFEEFLDSVDENDEIGGEG